MLPELLTRIRTVYRNGVAVLDEAVRFILDDRYWVQEKRDGERLMVRRWGQRIEGWNKTGQNTTVPAALMSALLAMSVSHFILDGELEPTGYYCWDLLHAAHENLTGYPYRDRYEILKVFAPCPAIRILESWTSAAAKEKKVFELLTKGAEGIVFKDSHAPYVGGRAGQHFKLKFEKTATVRVRTVEEVSNSASIEMFDGQAWVEVSGVKIKQGTVRPGDYLEVRYLSGTQDRRLVQPVFIRSRTDVGDADCSIDQVEFAGRWAHLSKR